MVIALDVSRSITRHNLINLVLNFAKRIVQRLDVSLSTNLIGVIQFGQKAEFSFTLQEYTTTSDVLSAINDFSKNYPQHLQTSFVPLLQLLGRSANDVSLGFRPNYPNVGIIITDGKSTTAENLESEAVKLHNKRLYQLYAVGVGKGAASLEELEMITKDITTVFLERELDDEKILQLERRLYQRLCQSKL